MMKRPITTEELFSRIKVTLKAKNKSPDGESRKSRIDATAIGIVIFDIKSVYAEKSIYRLLYYSLCQLWHGDFLIMELAEIIAG